MSYTLNKRGAQIDAIFLRAEAGGTIDDAIALKAPFASPALTGTPTAPTAAAGTDTTQIATTAFVTDAVQTEAEADALRYAPAIVVPTSSAPVTSFSDGADNVPLKSATFQIVPAQSGSGTPAPNNVRPISGWTGANIVVSPTLNAQDGTTYAIDWTTAAGTVYGGTLEYKGGGAWRLTAEYIKIIIDGTVTASWAAGTTTNRARFSETSQLWANGAPKLGNQTANIKLDKFQSIQDSNIVFSAYLSSGALALRLPLTVTDTTDISAWFAANPTEFCYPLATPQSYDLTGADVLTLLGANNIWSDTGDAAVEYRADTKLYIDGQIAALQALVLENNG